MRSIAAALVIMAAIAGTLVSDIFIRGVGLDGTHGINAHANDVAFTIVLVVGLCVLAFGSRES